MGSSGTHFQLKQYARCSLTCQGEKLDELYATIVESLKTPGPVAVVIKRKMAPGGESTRIFTGPYKMLTP